LRIAAQEFSLRPHAAQRYGLVSAGKAAAVLPSHRVQFGLIKLSLTSET
jgi:hypothetical protein